MAEKVFRFVCSPFLQPFFLLQCFPNPSQQAPFRFFLFFVWNTGLFNALDTSLDAQCSPVKKLVANCGQSRSPPKYSLIHCSPWSARRHVAPSASTRTRERTRYNVRAARPCVPKSCLIWDRAIRTSFFLSQTSLSWFSYPHHLVSLIYFLSFHPHLVVTL